MTCLNTEKMARLFIAFPISDAIQRKYAALQERGREQLASMRWSRADPLHLTLLFLGETPQSDQRKVEAIIRACAASIPPFMVEISTLGLFPHVRAPRILWVGISEEAPMMALQKMLAEQIGALGFPIEKRPFRPHLTLGRIKKGMAAHRLADWMKQEEGIHFGKCCINEVILMESQLGPEGPCYLPRLTTPLGRG